MVSVVAVHVLERVLHRGDVAGVDRRETVGEVVVVAAIEGLQDGPAFAVQVIRQAKPCSRVRVDKERMSSYGGRYGEDAASITRLRGSGDVSNRRFACGIAIAQPLVVDPGAEGDREAVVGRPAILHVPAVVQIEVGADRPRRAVRTGIAHVDEADPIRGD